MLKSALEAGRFYGYSLIQLLIEPGQFFTDLTEKTTIGKALGFMVITCSFFTIASLLTGISTRPTWIMALIFFMNASTMILLSSVLGYLAMVMTLGKRALFSTVFNLYVFSSGITLFISWLPFFLWLTEPWKWWLIYTGYTHTCRFSRKQALLILVVSITAQCSLVYSAILAFAR